jgi:hypothetical protein
MTAGPGGHVEHAPARLPGNRPADERDRVLRVGVIAVRVELEVFLAEPFLEPFRQSPTSPCGMGPPTKS